MGINPLTHQPIQDLCLQTPAPAPEEDVHEIMMLRNLDINFITNSPSSLHDSVAWLEEDTTVDNSIMLWDAASYFQDQPNHHF